MQGFFEAVLPHSAALHPTLHLTEALAGVDLKTLIFSPERKALISSPVFFMFLIRIYPHCMWRKVLVREAVSVWHLCGRNTLGSILGCCTGTAAPL